MKQAQVAGGAPFCCCCCCCSSLRLSILSAHELDYFIRVQASIASATAVFLTFSALLFTSLSLVLSRSLLPAPGPQTAWLNTQANVSLFKETQVVDMLAAGQDPNEELL